MNKESRWISFLIILFCILLSQACATLIRKRTQKIPVTSDPAGAMVSVNGQQQGVTPLVIRLARNEKNQVIRIESPGYHPFEIRLKRELSGIGIIGNSLFGIAAGYLVAILFVVSHEHEDVHTKAFTIWGATAAAITGGLTLIDLIGKGKGYSLKPAELRIQLTKIDGPPRVDTLLIDADDFHNVKWIRVHVSHQIPAK